MPQASFSSWQGSLNDLANLIYQIRRLRVFGRLLLRNSERLSIAQLYFRAGKLVHIAGNRGDARAILSELQEWTHGFIRFDRGVTTSEVTLNEMYERILEQVLMNLQRNGVVHSPALPRVIEGDLVASSRAKQLLTPAEWRILAEAARRVSLAVAHLVGPKRAIRVLQDILKDCSAAFPAFIGIRIAPTGYLVLENSSKFDQLSREDILEGFTALITTCQYFCSPLIGEREAHQLIVQALQGIGPSVSNLGIFRVNDRLLSMPADQRSRDESGSYTR
ncbi:MAG TPA: hypothetical protein VFB60_08795 [Ktedonobacteraceae bacterium]|nr:hypothetical protein [Ktedonobacteraceae bacterium]